MWTTSRPYWTMLLCWTVGIAAAASKSDKVDRVVDAVLEQETRGAVSRRADDLGDLVGQSDRARWAAGYVHTADGWEIFDAASPRDARLSEYKERRGTEPLTPERHLQLANWCREQKLSPQERAHLWAMVGNNPSDNSIFQRLGYTNVGGDWLTPDDLLRMNRRQQQAIQDLKVWTPRAQRIRNRLSKPQAGTQALGRAELFEITDHRATFALEKTLSNGSPELSAELVAWCKRVRHIDTTMVLARQSILAPSEATRNLAADALRSRPRAHYVPSLLTMLAKPTEAKLLRTSTELGRGNVVLAYQFQRETWNAVENGAYVVRSTGMNVLPENDPPVSGSISPATLGINQSILARNITDLDRAIQDEIQRRTSLVTLQNRLQSTLNVRVSQSLSVAIGVDREARPEELWNWWDRETASEPTSSTDKPQVLTEVEEDEFVPQQAFQPFTSSFMIAAGGATNTRECLCAGTQIVTSTGSCPIESLRIGDVVLAKDIETGELAYKPVIRTTVRSPQPLMTLHTAGESIRTTLGHYFWISGRGWRMAKEIKPGDRLHGVQGTVTVTDVSRGGHEAVYNLVVEGANTYFVGEGKILSHDVTPPVPTDIIVPGLAAR